MTAPDDVAPDEGPALAPGEVPPPPVPRIPTGISWDLPAPAEDAPRPEDLRAGRLELGPSAGDSAVLAAAPVQVGPGDYRVNPVPTVTLDGVDVASGTGGQAILPGQLVVDGVTVTWGRTELLAQPEMGTARVALFDTTQRWAVRRSLIGKSLKLRWTMKAPGLEDYVLTYFLGRVTTVKVTPKTITQRRADGTWEDIRGSLVAFTCTSILSDLSNITPTVDWPDETMNGRRARIAAAAPVGLFSQIGIRDFWTAPHVAPVTAADQRSLYDHLVSLYDSCGADRMVFQPWAAAVGFIPRRDYYNVRALAGLWWHQPGETHSRAGKGAFLRSYSVQPASGIKGTPTYVDARELEYDPTEGLTRGPEQRVSRVAVTNPDGSTSAYAMRTTILPVPGVDEITEGIRQAQLDSVVSWNSWADVSASDLQAFVSKEGQAWKLAPVRYDTRRAGGFEDPDAAIQWLQGSETATVFALERTFMSSYYALRPLFGIMGATIEYRDGGWVVEATLAPISTTLPQHAITWEEIDDGTDNYRVEWWDDDNPRGLHESLTYEDLGFCGTGVGMTIIPPDIGRDETIGS